MQFRVSVDGSTERAVSIFYFLLSLAALRVYGMRDKADKWGFGTLSCFSFFPFPSHANLLYSVRLCFLAGSVSGLVSCLLFLVVEGYIIEV
jgi:hypothetical protein